MTDPAALRPCADTTHDASTPAGLTVEAHALPVPPALAGHVQALVWARFDPFGQPYSTVLMPYPGFLLNVSMGDPHAADSDGRGQVKAVTLRRLNETGARLTTRATACCSLLALLAPAAALQLMQLQRAGESGEGRLPLRSLIGLDEERRLVAGAQRAHDPAGQLQALAAWLERMLLDTVTVAPEQRRLARALKVIEAQPSAPLSALCSDVGIGRRTMERQARLWLGSSPSQHQRLVRLQQAARLAWRRQKAVDIAMDLGFADQAHLSRTVSQLTGMKAGQFMGRMETPLAAAFRHATEGANLFPRRFDPMEPTPPVTPG